MAWGFTSGTTSGTSGSIRQALEVSMQTAPAMTADGQNSLEPLPPAARSAISTPSKESCFSSPTTTGFPLNSSTCPALLLLARHLISPTGKSPLLETLNHLRTNGAGRTDYRDIPESAHMLSSH